jgi:cytochrome c biogenesis protein CcmG/thiol:disulfide interchange protein DsbE
MSGTARNKGFWVAAALLTAFGIARILTFDANAQDDLLGKKAPDFTLETVSGRTVSMKDLRGKFVVLDFWAVWCGPCQQSMPFFQKIQNDYGKYGLEVIGVHVDDRMPPADTVKEYLDDRGIQYDTLMSTVEVDDKFMIYAMPTTFIIDRSGKVAKVHVGFNPSTTPAEVEKEIRTLLDLE